MYETYYDNYTDYLSIIHTNVCVQNRRKRTCPGFDPVTPLCAVTIQYIHSPSIWQVLSKFSLESDKSGPKFLFDQEHSQNGLQKFSHKFHICWSSETSKVHSQAIKLTTYLKLLCFVLNRLILHCYRSVSNIVYQSHLG